MTHTKGPWANVMGEDIYHGVEIEDSEGYCHMATKEDLSLMALAPEMLGLLRNVYQEFMREELIPFGEYNAYQVLILKKVKHLIEKVDGTV